MTGTRGAARWLASASDNPAACLREWRVGAHGVVLLPAGRLWDALAIPELPGRSLLNALAHSGHAMTGPVLYSSRRRELVLLMAPGGPPTGLDRAARYLTSGTWLAVPDPARQVTGPAWLVPPDGSGALFSPADVYRALAPRRAVAQAQTPGTRRPAARTGCFRALLRHLVGGGGTVVGPGVKGVSG